MAENIIRRSPVAFDGTPAQTEMRDSWNVVLEYENQGDGPWVIDLSHRARWDLQDREIDAIQPWGLTIPAAPGRCSYGNGVLVNRMNRTQSSLWHLAGEQPESPEGTAYTDVTDATVFLALIGKSLSALVEKLTSLDFFSPLNQPPFFATRTSGACPLPVRDAGQFPEQGGYSVHLLPGVCPVYGPCGC
jgi:hypothetical protein